MAFKSGFISIVGRPNVGKSTLVNSLTGEKISIISDKPQTTRNNLRAIITEKNYQIVFIDTPGIHKPKNKLGEFMVSTATNSLSEVNGIVYIYDATEKNIGPGDHYILEQIKQIKETPVFLVLNKIDLIKKEDLLELISKLSAEYEFTSVIPMSALKGQGVPLLSLEICKILPEGPMYYPDDIITDSPVRQICTEIIREKILNFTNEEVPHGVGVEILTYKDRPKSNIADIEATIFCEKDSHKGIIIGKNGSMLKRIGTSARIDMEKLTGGKVNLQLWVKVKDDWRNNPGMLKELGFRKN